MYTYANGDPVGVTDPTGHIGIAEALVEVAVVAILVTLTYIHYHPRPVRLGLMWKNSFTWKNYLHLRKQDPLAQADVAAIKANALESLKQAYSRFGAIIIEGVGNHTAEVDNDAPHCGDTRFGASSYSFVSYACALSGAQYTLQSADPKLVSPAVGRGIGNIAAHEIGHQLHLSEVDKDLKLPGTYDNGDAGDPALYDGTPLVWTSQSLAELPGKLKPN
jgi:hypothetical protein